MTLIENVCTYPPQAQQLFLLQVEVRHCDMYYRANYFFHIILISFFYLYIIFVFYFSRGHSWDSG